MTRSSKEFRSDTFTVPSERMMEAIREASVGDSVYEEDEDTNSLQKRIQELTGKAGALFFPSGTMSNQVGVRSNLHQPPYSIVADDRAHVYRNEAAGLAILSQAIVYPAFPSNGLYLTLEDIKKRVIDFKDIHVATTKLVCLENTLNGIIMPLDEIKRISEYAKANGIRMHLDGARLWNASAETGISLKEYCQYFDTVSLCLSKGLGAPIGSVLVADETTIETARWIRKQQGGGMRQVGLLAAPANVAIDEVWPTMKATHLVVKKLAQYLEEELSYKFEGPVETNFIFIDGPRSGVDIVILEEEAKKRGLNVVSNRLAFHYQISPEAIELLKEAAKAALERSREIGVKPEGGDSEGIAVAGSKSGSHKYAPVKN
ncbi:uncharacterized protein SAPINGB_P003767 [Magnusiomyces paraingens]|uniref:low-specificity L-threonine aldolase n=1 Tax=Magnusiomyces paraingens TaxID=2606893 RepID=A0A5E8BRW7_9ASCO|nr:uncharacterized protein SAPINGB_P003767 [Saprochaete ingens]VVT53821.1 unnamed protein product [Saprochaete ingens]